MSDDLNFLIAPDSAEEVALDETSNFDMTPAATPAPENNDDAVQTVGSVIPYDTGTVNLGKDKFAALMSVFQMIKPSAQNLFIKDGKVTQLNDKKSMIFEIDLTPILGSTNVLLSSLQAKFDALIPFRKQNVEVFLDIDPRGYVFRDAQTKIHYARLVESVLGNTVYVTPQQVVEKADIDPTRRIFSYVWTKKMLDRVIHYAKILGTPVFKVEFNGDSIACKLQSLDNASTTQITLLTLEDEVDDNTLVNKFTTFPTQSLVNFIQGGVVEVQSDMYVRRDTSRPAVAIKLAATIPIAGTNSNIVAITYVGGYLEEVTDQVQIG